MGNESHVGLIKEYSGKIEAELSKICEGILKLLESQLVLSVGGAESKVFYLKMKENTKGILQSSRLVQRGMRPLRHHGDVQGCSEIAFSELAPTNPIRLGLALNFSVFYYEILNAPDRACNLAKQLKGLIQKGERLDIDLEWRMHVVSDGQMHRVQICMGLLQPYKVLLLDEITVDLDVVTRMDLLDFFKEECEQVICDTNVNQYMEWVE